MQSLSHRYIRLTKRAAAIVLLTLGGSAPFLGLVRGASAQSATAVEYYHTGWDHYFVTAFADEIALLDGGAFGGVWTRTGATFNVWSQPDAGLAETCRFFSTSFAPKSSHFYTPFSAECADVKNNASWQFESIAFYLQLADSSGTCPAGTTVLYRLYNNGMGDAPNHRYTTSQSTVSQMHEAGWISEGNGLTGAFACAKDSSAPATAEGMWTGTTSLDESARVFILDDGTFYLLYSEPGGGRDAGVVQGKLNPANGTFATSAVNVPIVYVTEGGPSSTVAFVQGTYIPRVSLQMTINGIPSRSVSAVYDPTYERPANPAEAQRAATPWHIGTFVGRTQRDLYRECERRAFGSQRCFMQLQRHRYAAQIDLPVRRDHRGHDVMHFWPRPHLRAHVLR